MVKSLRSGFCIALTIAVVGGSVNCAQAQSSSPNETGGALFGAIIGGVIGSSIGGNAGSRIVGGIAGVAIGGLIGGSIGAYLDEQERKQLAAMTQATARTGKSGHYRGKSGVISTRVSSNAGSCRTVEQQIVLPDGSKRTDSVQACRTAEGWKFG